jgi:hypothetical protein
LSSVSEVSQRFVSTMPQAATRSMTITIRPSILRLGLKARLLGAALLLAAIWAMVGWTLQ